MCTLDEDLGMKGLAETYVPRLFTWYEKIAFLQVFRGVKIFSQNVPKSALSMSDNLWI